MNRKKKKNTVFRFVSFLSFLLAVMTSTCAVLLLLLSHFFLFLFFSFVFSVVFLLIAIYFFLHYFFFFLHSFFSLFFFWLLFIFFLTFDLQADKGKCGSKSKIFFPSFEKKNWIISRNPKKSCNKKIKNSLFSS